METFLQKIKGKKSAALLLVFPLAVYFFFGLQHITKFETADEHYWIYSNNVQNNYWDADNGRIKQYWTAIANWDLKKTRINDKPGITLAYVSGVGAWLRSDLDAKILRGEIPAMSKVEKAEKINFYFRLPLLIFNGFFMFALFYLLRRLLKSDWVAIMACSLMLLSPIVVGISQIINPDSLLWEFGFAALLSFLIFLRDGDKKFIFWTAVFLGLSLLTKYSSVIFFPFFLATFILYVIANHSEFKEKDGSKKIASLAIGIFLIFFGALAIYAVIMPNNLIEFKHFLKGSVGFKGMGTFFTALFILNGVILVDALIHESRTTLWLARKVGQLEFIYAKLIIVLPAILIVAVVTNTISGTDYLNLFKIPFDASKKEYFRNGFDYQLLLRQFLPLAFSLSPIIVLAFLFASFKNIKKSAQFHWIALISSFFMLVYVSAVTLQEVPLTIRYGIMLYPIIMTLAAVGVYQIVSRYKGKQLILGLILSSIFVAGIASLQLSKPFYFNYTSILLPEKYIITDSWGYGGYEAAQYLNQLPNAEKIRVWSDYNGVCVFFNGSCSANKLTMQNIQKDAKKAGKAAEFGYFISNRRGHVISRGLWEDLLEQYKSKPVLELEINNRPQNFVKVYENNQL